MSDPETMKNFDTASVSAAAATPSSQLDLATTWLVAAERSGCRYIRAGVSVISEGRSAESDSHRSFLKVKEEMPDGTAISGLDFPTMFYIVPKGNVVASSVGAIICADSSAIDVYKASVTAWSEKNEPNMSSEELIAASPRVVEDSAKLAGCSYAHPGASIVAQGGIHGGNGSGANLNLIVTAHLADGTIVWGVTIPAMITEGHGEV